MQLPDPFFALDELRKILRPLIDPHLQGANHLQLGDGIDQGWFLIFARLLLHAIYWTVFECGRPSERVWSR